jgi:hypothetical protein
LLEIARWNASETLGLPGESGIVLILEIADAFTCVTARKTPPFDLQDALAHVYDSGGYDLDLNYQKAPAPPLTGEAATWAKEIIANYPQPS